MNPHDYRTTAPPNTIDSANHTFPICTGIGDKIQIGRIFLDGITSYRGVAEITVTAEISEIPVEKKGRRVLPHPGRGQNRVVHAHSARAVSPTPRIPCHDHATSENHGGDFCRSCCTS
jgi:hypothetical protein